jgi:hypothetical protein
MDRLRWLSEPISIPFPSQGRPDQRIPFRTLTWTLLYPLVMFFTPRTTLDIPPPGRKAGAVSMLDLRRTMTGSLGSFFLSSAYVVFLVSSVELVPTPVVAMVFRRR